jgi:RimJ/RimL family protein N-acetyltransferase
VFAIDRHGGLIGLAGYTPSSDGAAAEIGYWIAKPCWGNGFATEAVTAVVEHCSTRHRFARLTCGHFVDNAGSRRVIEKLGFIEIGRARQWCEARRQDAEVVQYEMTLSRGRCWGRGWPGRHS